MPPTIVHASLEKMASDGDYGRELAQASISYECTDGEDAVQVLAVLQAQVRLRVEHDLAESANLKVRRSVIRQERRCSRCGEPLADADNGYLHSACKLAEDAEREARYQERLAKERAEESAEVELAAGLRDNARSNYDDDEDIPL